MVNFLEKVFVALFAFFYGCYFTAVRLDEPFVKQKQKEVLNYIQKFLYEK